MPATDAWYAMPVLTGRLVRLEPMAFAHAAGYLAATLGGGDVDAALALLRDGLRPGDGVLVKASRAAGLERVAAALLADTS